MVRRKIRPENTERFPIEPPTKYSEESYVRHKGKQLNSMMQDEEHRGIDYDVSHNFAPKSVLPPPRQHMGHKWIAFLKKRLKKLDNLRDRPVRS